MYGEICFCSIMYILLCLIMVYPPDEVVAIGLTVENVLGSWLGSEMSSFVQYHHKRTVATLMVHSLFVPGM